MMQINVNPELLSQAIVTTIEVKRVAKRVRFEFDYMEAPDKWFVCLYDAQSGEPYCLNIPVIASYTGKNDLFEPYHYKDIGQLVCVPVVDDPSSVDPSVDNMDEFAVIWGEDIA